MWLKHVYVAMSEHSRSDREGLPPVGDESETVHEVLFREIADAVFLLDVESTEGDYRFRFRWNNASHRQRTGFSTDDLRGKTPRELLGDDRGATIADNYRRCVSAGETIQYEETLELPDGTSHWQTKLTPVTEDGTVTRIIGVARDITDQKERERERRAMARRFETVLETMSTAVFLKSTDGEYYLMNRACRELLGIDDEDITGLTDEDIFPPDVVEQARTDDRTVAETDEMIEVEETVPTKSGDSIRLTRKSPVYDESGEITAICGVSTDITERKRREQEIEQLTERLSLALRSTNTGVWELDPATDEVIWTESMERLFGIDPGTFDGTYDGFAERVHPDDLPAVDRAVDRSVSTGEPLQIEYRIQADDGKHRWVESRAELVGTNDDERRMIGVATDISDGMEYEQAIEATQEKLRQIIDLVPDLIFVKNSEGEYLLANEATAAAYGATPEEIEGNREAEVIPDADDSEEFRRDDLDVLSSGQPKTIPEEELTTADGETRVLETTKIPYQVADSGDEAVLGYARDITALKEYEETLERQRDNLEVLNQVVRHDVRNALQLVLAYGATLEPHVDESGEEYLRQILEAGREAVDITRTAGDVTEVLLHSDGDRRPVSLRHILEAQVEEARSSHERAIVSIDGTVPDTRVLADDLLESVFRNLLNNAVVHNDTDLPSITVSATVTEERTRVRVADNGPGIPDERKDELFERGRKGLDSDGTGIGLYLVRTLVDRYGGDVWVEDADTGGSAFVVELERHVSEDA